MTEVNYTKTLSWPGTTNKLRDEHRNSRPNKVVPRGKRYDEHSRYNIPIYRAIVNPLGQFLSGYSLPIFENLSMSTGGS